MRIEGELRREVSSKLPSINRAMLRKSWFHLSKTTHFVMPTKKQTRQRNARNRRNHYRKHHRQATCAKLFGAPVSTPILVPKSMQNHQILEPDRSRIDLCNQLWSTWAVSASIFGLLGRSWGDSAASSEPPGSILGRSGLLRRAYIRPHWRCPTSLVDQFDFRFWGRLCLFL